jgi:hypothetical protein
MTMAKKTAKKKAKKATTKSTKRTIRARRPKPAAKPKVKANGAIDLTKVTSHLRECLQSRAPVSYDRGRQRMRAELMEELECSEMRAEHIVSSLVARGYARFGPHPLYRDNRTVGRWTFHLPQAEA